MNEISLYIHIPFCNHRCGYCDFNTYLGLQHLIPEYSQALIDEISYISLTSPFKLPIHTIYFGGGTPSLIPDKQLEKILEAIYRCFQVSSNVEISLEANPGTVNQGYLKKIHNLGINRLSLGMQTAQADELALLERQHSYQDVFEAVAWARLAGYHNLNLDLIYGLPGQRLEAWLDSVDKAIALNPEHLSLYALTLEDGTPMKRKIEKGLLAELDPDQAADMYEAASERLAEAGFIQYEISNWARKKNLDELYSCSHNVQYWRNLPYLGVGAGAHGFINQYRTVDVDTPAAYIRKMKNGDLTIHDEKFPCTPATVQSTFIDREAEIGETMMMGLRLVSEGVCASQFSHRFGISLSDKFGAQIARLRDFGLLEWTNEPDVRLRLTQKGYLLGNQVFREFI